MTQYTQIDAERIEKASNMMKAIAHPLRLSIINNLSEGEERTVTEIHEMIGIEQSTASHHLRILKDKGVLVSRRNGKNTFYKLRNKNLKNLLDCIDHCACMDDH